MRIDVITLFPELFEVPLKTSLLGKALADRLFEVNIVNLREFGLGKHRQVDDTPYGGGAGMVLRPEPVFAAVETVAGPSSYKVLMSPRGTLLTQEVAKRLSAVDHLVLVCGRYEGVDERVVEHLVDEELSIGDYVLSGGELAALVVIEVLSRLVEGVLGNPESLTTESHGGSGLEHPHYTKPADFRGHEVPGVLLSGDHAAIERWRTERARELTEERRPDLLA